MMCVLHSCFSSYRINLSPFTKDVRGEGHNEYKHIFDALLNCGAFNRIIYPIVVCFLGGLLYVIGYKI